MLRKCLYPMCNGLTADRFCEKHQDHENKTRRRCAFPGCSTLVVMSVRYCETHEEEMRRRYDEERGGPRSRGYSKHWDKVSQAYRASHPVCEECEKLGKVTPSVVTHHIKAVSEGGEWFDESNLQALCASCHSKKPGHGRR